jgi:uncharacterized protein YegP (UPF0339 family)
VSKESDLELKLSAYNAKIIFLSNMYRKLNKIKLGHLLIKKINHNTNLRNECFTELRNLLKTKRPELFIGGTY